MEGFVLETSYWYPLAYLGVTHAFFRVDTHTVVMTWILLAFMSIFVVLVRQTLPYQDNLARCMLLTTTRMFMDFVTQTLRVFSFQHFSFSCSIFLFIFFSSLLSLVPFFEEPTQNINTALALGISAFLYVQYNQIHARGFLAYCKGFLSPFFLMLPLNIISTCSTAISLSFRLFGNIFGGAIINSVVFGAVGAIYRLFFGSTMSKIAGFLLSLIGLSGCLAVSIFFGIFEGMLQAFVFFMLTLTYLSLALEGAGH